jgi:hypothetical protein
LKMLLRRSSTQLPSPLLGDLAAVYMVLPAIQPVRERLTVAARRYSVPLDGDYP